MLGGSRFLENAAFSNGEIVNFTNISSECGVSSPTIKEHFIYQEIYAHCNYSNLQNPISHWRTTSQIEIDFVLGDHEVAIEVKGTDNDLPRHLKGLRSFAEEYSTKKSISITNDPYPRKIDDITILPWSIFLDKLWSGEIIS